ncbi:hypothetical protein [Dactylosporangium darangshiense]|uniref:hypothetical protein n=1 Tax=Dactylosporangium darangshiense TaxID=579108 RepID=UPI00363B89A9
MSTTQPIRSSTLSIFQRSRSFFALDWWRPFSSQCHEYAAAITNSRPKNPGMIAAPGPAITARTMQSSNRPLVMATYAYGWRPHQPRSDPRAMLTMMDDRGK